MKKIPFIILILLCCQLSFAVQKTLSKKEIEQLVKDGNKFFKEAEFIKSLKTLKIALIQAENAKEFALASMASNRIARNFEEISEEQNALLFFYKALDYAEKAKSYPLKSTVYINLGNLLTLNKNLDFQKGISYMMQARKLSLQEKDFETAVTVNMNLALTYFDMNKFEKGYPYLAFVNNNFEKFGEKKFFITVKMLNGMYFSYLNDNEKANEQFLAGINHNLDQDAVLREEKQDLYLNYSKFLSKTGNFQNAYINLIKHNQISEKLFNKKKLVTANLSGLNLMVESYKNDLLAAEIEKKSQSKLLSFSNNVIYVFAGLLLVLACLLTVIFFSNQKNIKINNTLITNNEQLEIAIQKADEANKIKSQFVATITHELRTPLYGVIGITDLIFDEYKQIIDSKPIEALRFSARYLLALINDVLQISKMEAVAMTLENKIFDLRKEVNSIKNALDIIASNKHVSLQIDIDKNIPECIAGDQIRLSQVLMNLLSNSLKFTAKGKVLLSISVNKIVDKHVFINFIVKDTGIGISEENQKTIFDKFIQINEDQGNYQGTGLGLSIVKKIIDLFGSEIYLESQIGVGSAFSFTIGFDIAQDLEADLLPISYLFFKGMKVLVVEDNKINQLVSKKIIEKKGMYCQIVSSGQEAIYLLKNESFDIILMDINMPIMNGFESTIALRNLKIDTPVIALTAYSKSQIEHEAIAAGINAVIEKPFEPQQLFELIAKHIVVKSV